MLLLISKRMKKDFNKKLNYEISINSFLWNIFPLIIKNFNKIKSKKSFFVKIN